MDTDRFEPAVVAIVTGDAVTLASLLANHPSLVYARSTREHRATLLHYLGANGVEEHRQKSPGNAVAIAKILLDAGAEVDAVADIYGKSTTLGLVATSTHPRRAGRGRSRCSKRSCITAQLSTACLNFPVLCSPHSTMVTLKPAEFLARHGAILDLEGAAGVGLLDIVQSYFHDATSAESGTGLTLGLRVRPHGCHPFPAETRSGCQCRRQHRHDTSPLGYRLADKCRRSSLLLQQGANLEARNKYGGTALGQALWSAANGDPDISYAPVIEALQSR